MIIDIRLNAGRFLYDGVGWILATSRLLCFIGAIEYTSKETSLNGRLINNDTIFLIIASKTGHGDNRVASNGHFSHGDVFGCLGPHERSLRIIEDMCHGL